MLNDEEIKHFNINSIRTDDETGYILVVHLSYPSHLHDEHADYPLAPEKYKVTYDMLSPLQKWCYYMSGKCSSQSFTDTYQSEEKLIPNLLPKDKYVVHISNLKLYMEYGLELKHIYQILKFDQSCWLKPYIDYTTKHRMNADNQFDINFFKLVINAMFGKTMEDKRKRRNIELVNTVDKLEKLTAKPTFKSFTIFTENLVSIENYRATITLDKPIYIGFTVLELSKILMYRFHYGYIKRRYPLRLSELLFTDTDSLAYKIQTDDIYSDMMDEKEKFDWSDYPDNHPVFKDMKEQEILELKKMNKKV